MLFMYRLLSLYSGSYLEAAMVTCGVFVLLILNRLYLTHTCEVHWHSLASKLLGYTGKLARDMFSEYVLTDPENLIFFLYEYHMNQPIRLNFWEKLLPLSSRSSDFFPVIIWNCISIFSWFFSQFYKISTCFCCFQITLEMWFLWVFVKIALNKNFVQFMVEN